MNAFDEPVFPADILVFVFDDKVRKQGSVVGW